MWDAALVIRYGLPVRGREVKALELFADGITLFGKLAADGYCAEPEVFLHRDGGGMMLVRIESTIKAHEILEMNEVRTAIDTALFVVDDYGFDVMVTGERAMTNMAEYTTVGTALGLI